MATAFSRKPYGAQLALRGQYFVKFQPCNVTNCREAAGGSLISEIQKYEKGVNRIAAARLDDFANALDVPVSEFFVGAKDAERRSVASPRAAFDPQAFRIAEAFAKITDEQIRRFLLRFTETMAQKFGDSA